MKLLTQELRKQLPALYAQDGKGDEAIVYAKFFTPDSNYTWYITEGGPAYESDEDKRARNSYDYHFFGLVIGQCPELGYSSLSELEGVRGKLGLPIERDLYWTPKTLGEVKKQEGIA